MPTYERANKAIDNLAEIILRRFDSHEPLIKCGVTFDFLMARADMDQAGMPVGDALRHGGHRALGLCRIIPLKQRALDRADAEISLDGDWWNEASPEERAALLDHELHHLAVKTDKSGIPVKDDLGRPKLRLRKHDFQFGWFSLIAARHGAASQECVQAKYIADNAGTFLFPKEIMDGLKNGTRVTRPSQTELGTRVTRPSDGA